MQLTPLKFIILAVFAGFLLLIFFIGFGVKVSAATFLGIGVLTGVGALIIWYFMHQVDKTDPMELAKIYMKEYWLKNYDEKFEKKQIKAYRRLFPGDDQPFFGAIMHRFSDELHDRAGVPACIVLQRAGTSFHVVKEIERAEQKDIDNPFCDLETYMKGAPVKTQQEPMSYKTAPIGTVVNVGDNKKEDTGRLDEKK